MDPETQQKLEELEVKVDAVWKSVEKIRKYMTITFWVTVVVFVLPLLASIIIIPKVINSYLDLMGGF